MIIMIYSYIVINGKFFRRAGVLVWVEVFQKYLENYTDGVDLVHCTKGTCNLSELIGIKIDRWDDISDVGV